MPDTTAPELPREFKSSLRSAWILGIASTGFGIYLFARYGLFSSLPEWQRPYEILALFGWIIPGLVIVTSAVFLNRKEPWAATMARVTIGWQILVAIFFLYVQFTNTPISAVPLVMNIFWGAALTQFFWELVRAGPAIRMMREEQWRGFEITAINPQTPKNDNT
jgi:hypothetical protein